MNDHSHIVDSPSGREVLVGQMKMGPVRGPGGAWRASRRVWAGAVSSMMPNKTPTPKVPICANNRRFCVSIEGGIVRFRLLTRASNKPNSPRSWPENEDRAKEQTQSKPISRLGGLWRIRIVVSRPSGRKVRATPCRLAPNKANFRGFQPENWGRAKKQSQFPGRKAHRLSPLCGCPAARRNVRLSPLTPVASGLMMARSEHNPEPRFHLVRALVAPHPHDEPGEREWPV